MRHDSAAVRARQPNPCLVGDCLPPLCNIFSSSDWRLVPFVPCPLGFLYAYVEGGDSGQAGEGEGEHSENEGEEDDRQKRPRRSADNCSSWSNVQSIVGDSEDAHYHVHRGYDYLQKKNAHTAERAHPKPRDPQGLHYGTETLARGMLRAILTPICHSELKTP